MRWYWHNKSCRFTIESLIELITFIKVSSPNVNYSEQVIILQVSNAAANQSQQCFTK